MTEKASAGALIQHLERHYIKPGQDLPGGIFVPEVGLNNGASQRRCDAIYVGFTSTSGRILVGHELKVSRADWRHELDQPEKSELWAGACHAWYVVAPSMAIVPKEELPPGWGLMIPNARSKNRMDVVVRSDIKPAPHEPPWLVTRSIMARLDTLQANRRWLMRQEEEARARAELEARDSRRRSQFVPESNADSRIVDDLEHVLGINLRGGRGTPMVSPQNLASAIKIVRNNAVLDGYRGLTGLAQQMRELSMRLDENAAEASALMNTDLPTDLFGEVVA